MKKDAHLILAFFGIGTVWCNWKTVVPKLDDYEPVGTNDQCSCLAFKKRFTHSFRYTRSLGIVDRFLLALR